MANGWKTQLTRQIGEHLTAVELGRRDYAASPFAGNVPLFDLIAADSAGYVIPIQVKAINGGDWQLSAGSFLNILIGENSQTVVGLRANPNPTLIYVLISLKERGSDEFYIISFSELQERIAHSYKPRVCPKNVKSFHYALRTKDMSDFRDRWDKLEEAFRIARGGPIAALPLQF